MRTSARRPSGCSPSSVRRPAPTRDRPCTSAPRRSGRGWPAIADRDGDQRISRDEFVGGAVKRLRDNPDRFAEIARPFLHAALDLADRDGDGAATVGDTARVLTALGVSQDVAATAAATLDTDGDGKIGEAEIVSSFARYFTVPE